MTKQPVSPASPDAEAASSEEVAVLRKALDVLDALSATPASGLSELTTLSGANKASVFRILRTLESRGFAVKDPATKKYTPGPRLIMLARRVASQIDVSALIQPVLDDLRDCFGETVNFATLVGTEVHYLQVAESTRTLRTSPPVGTNDYLHCTALGKAILASLPPSEATEILQRVVLDKRTSYTITRRKALLEDLEVTRARGYTFDDEESEIGSRCLAVPVLGPDKHPVAALSISGPKNPP